MGQARYQRQRARLAKPKDGEAVFLEVAGGTDKLIEPTELIHLARSGIEHFITAPRPKPTFEIIVNTRARVVNDSHVTFEQVVQLAFPGVHEANVEFSITYPTQPSCNETLVRAQQKSLVPPNQTSPGFPQNSRWVVRSEGFSSAI